MFDFERWRDWLEAKAVELQPLSAELRMGELSPRPGMAFNLQTPTALAELRVWNTGEADYEVMDLRTKEFAESISGMILDDVTFEGAFDLFLRSVAAVR